jgi:hypothetical protein
MSPAAAAEALELIREIREIIARIADDLRATPDRDLRIESRTSRERFERMLREHLERRG